MGALKFRMYEYRGTREVIIERDTTVNGRPQLETAGLLMWNGDQFGWQLPEEAFASTILTPKEVTCILGLLNWLNSR